MVGKTTVCENLFQKIECFAKRVLTELENEREQVEEVITTLKNIETKLLLADKFPDKIEEQYPDLKVKIKQKKNEIVFKGPHGQVREATLKMYELISYFTSTTTGELLDLKAGLYAVRKTKEHVVKKLKAKNLTAVWDIIDGCLVVCSTTQRNLKACEETMLGSVVENTIALTKDVEPMVMSEYWHSRIEELHVQYAGKCHIKVADDSSKVHVCATDDAAREILESMEKFIQSCTKKEVSCTKNIHHLIERQYKKALENIARDFHVKIDPLPGNGGFIVHGSEEMIQRASAELYELIHRVKQDQLQNPR